MPVDFQIKSAKVVPKGALVLVMHASEMADGNHWQKIIAKEAIKALGNEDYCGVLPGVDRWLWGDVIKVRNNRQRMLGLIDRMTPMDMPDFDSGFRLAHRGFSKLPDAAVKHMIVISDGDPAPPSNSMIAALRKLGVSVSAVAVGCHGPAESSVMKDLAKRTGGKYYEVLNPNALPRIFQKEAPPRRPAAGLRARKRLCPLHQISQRDRQRHRTIAADHRVRADQRQGKPAGRSLAGLTPAARRRERHDSGQLDLWPGQVRRLHQRCGARWTKSWTSWSGYDKLFSQAVRWSMRPAGDQGKFSVATEVEQGQVRVVVTALDKNDDFLNFLDLRGAVVGPDMQPNQLKLEQTAPGRYVGSFATQDTGAYTVMLSPGAGRAPILTGINVPYSSEFRDREADEALLINMARLQPQDGAAGAVLQDEAGIGKVDELLKTNVFRHDLAKATSRQDVWQYALLAAGLLFLADVFFRRVQVSFAWLPPLASRLRDRVLGRPQLAPAPEYMSRLRSRKAEVADELEQRRAAARFEPQPEAPGDAAALEEELKGPAPPKPPPARGSPFARTGQRRRRLHQSALESEKGHSEAARRRRADARGVTLFIKGDVGMKRGYWGCREELTLHFQKPSPYLLRIAYPLQRRFPCRNQD